MILYHTGTQEIREPDIRCGRKNADFGQGFYLTPDREFTYRWAGKDAVVNEYELDENGLCIHTFTRSDDWFRYIFDNRRMRDELSADVIIGPIANDTVFDTLGIMSSGYLRPEDSLKLLLIGPEYIQAVIKTDRAAKQLRFLRSEKIGRIAEGTRRNEQEEFLKAFTAELERITAAYTG